MKKAERSGLLIVLEGIDGSGKGTQLEFLETVVRQMVDGTPDQAEVHGSRVVVTKEPGGTQFGRAMRQLLLGTELGTRAISNEARQLGMLAAHIEHSTNVIEPALRSGKIVLCDRYLYSDFAYQDDDTPKAIVRCKEALMGPEPDLVIHLHGNAGVFLERAMARTTSDISQSDKVWSDADKLAHIQSKYFALFQHLQVKGKYLGVPADTGTPGDIFSTHIKPQVEFRLKKWLKKEAK